MVKFLSAMLNFGVNQQCYKNCEVSECCPFSCKIKLKNSELWKSFHTLGTEMIITKSGRRMFPSLQIQISDLQPNALYCVLLEMTPASQHRFKYSSAGGWFPAGTEEAQSPLKVYLHPDSPARGEFWMSQIISFGRLKLTNTITPPSGQMVLSSMHKYQPRIIIVKASDPREIAWAPSSSVAFSETEFIAVTAYQNDKITKLKIDNNPFAKGFRENGQAKCKRKSVKCDEELEGSPEKTRKLESLSPLKIEEDRLSPCSSPSSSVSSSNTPANLQSRAAFYSYEGREDSVSSASSSGSHRRVNEKDKPCSPTISSTYRNYSQSKESFYRPHSSSPQQNITQHKESIFSSSSLSPLSSTELSQRYSSANFSHYNFNPYKRHPLYSYPYYYPFSGYSSIWGNHVNPVFTPVSYTSVYPPIDCSSPAKEEIIDKPKKLTDFSIRAITGCK